METYSNQILDFTIIYLFIVLHHILIIITFITIF